MKKSSIEDGINYVSCFMGSMALDARARLKVNEIVPRVGLHWIYKSYPLSFYVAEVFLNMNEQSSGSGEVDCHRAQISQDPVPLINTNQLLIARYGR